MIRTLYAVIGPAERQALTRLLAWTCAASVLQGVVFAMLVPVLRALFGSDPSRAWPYLGAMLGICAVWAVVNYLGLRRGMESGATLSRGLRHRIGDHVAALPLGWFGPARVGDLSTLAGETVMNVAGAPAHLVRPLVAGFLTPATVVAVMFAFDWRLALAAAITTPIIAVVYRWSGGLTAKADRIRRRAAADAGGRVIEFAETQPVLRAYGATGRGHEVLDEALTVQRDASRRVLAAALPGLIGFGLVIQAAFIALVGYGTYLTLHATLSAPDLMALLVLAARFVEPLTEAAALGSALSRSANALAQVKDVLDVAPLAEPAPEAARRPDGFTIEFDDVTFGYGNEAQPKVLEHVSFTIPENTMTALVGPSGSGKTTITRLIARFFDVGDGAVRIGGIDVRHMPTDVLMSLISTVFQDVVLFEGTIAENIRIGRPGAGDDEVREAARRARVDEIVARLPRGWDTQVGEGGATLSGGERQRVSIARAILKDAPIVLLDEATAALDPENEFAVHAALAEMAADRTLLVVAHRLQTVAVADQILVLDHRTISERGTHAELLDAAGRYSAFWASRQKAANWRLASP
jgi:ATP-binding cassette subfamily B protein